MAIMIISWLFLSCSVQYWNRYFLLHTPALHLPLRISVQVVPSGTGVNEQPVVVLQVSVVQELLSLQTSVVLTHTPVVALQESVVHALLSLQFLAVPVHVPLVQASPDVQALLSLHVVPLETAVPWQK